MSASSLLSALAGKLKDAAVATIEKRIASVTHVAPAAHPPGATHTPKAKKPKKPKAARKYNFATKAKWRANERAGKYNF